MNQDLFESGYAAYQVGDWATAATSFMQAKEADEFAGRLDHLRGNALMQMGRYADAADAYADALADGSYGMSGALNTNRGRALLAAGKIEDARAALEEATKDPLYKTPYKANMALGSACRALGDVRGAGIAYRNAAIDESNPDPCASLRKLGGCFMDLGRPSDAIESYRTALDFSTDTKSQNMVYCDLALAYVACNRMNEAVDAFDHATADGSYTLTPEAQAAYDAARNAVLARTQERPRSETDEFLASTGYGNAGYFDPLDPTGETSGNLMPSPEDTGFFSLSEEDLMDQDRRERKGRGGKVFAVILVILLLLAGACGFAYYSGFGWPTQESVVEGIFAAKTDHGDAEAFVLSSLDDDARREIVSLVPAGATITINGVDRSMSASEVRVTASLASGGEQSYIIKLGRDGIGWKITSLVPDYVSLTGDDDSEEEDAEAAEDTASAEGEADQSTEAPAEDAPAEEAPAEEAPAEEAPAEEAPAEEAPAEEAPAEEAPVEEYNDNADVYTGEVETENI